MPKQKIEDNVLYEGVDEWVNKRTGEVITADQVIKKTGRNGFMITYLSAIINLIEVLGNRKMQVVKYILQHMDKTTNTLIITTEELANKSKVSRQTVSDTLKLLENAKIISRRTGAVMLDPKLAHKGNEQKERYLLAKFTEFAEDEAAFTSEED